MAAKKGRPGRTDRFAGDMALARKKLEEGGPDAVLAAAFVWIRDNLLRAFPPTEGAPETFVVGALALQIRATIFRALRQQFRRDASRTDAALLTTYSTEVGALMEQTRFALEDWWRQDFGAAPSDRLHDRVARAAIFLRNLPSRQGKSAGETVYHLHLIAVEAALDALPTQRSSGYGLGDAETAWEWIHGKETGLGWPLAPFDSSRLSGLTRTNLACELAVRAVKEPRLSARSLKNRLPKLRAMRDGMNAGLKRVAPTEGET